MVLVNALSTGSRGLDLGAARQRIEADAMPRPEWRTNANAVSSALSMTCSRSKTELNEVLHPPQEDLDLGKEERTYTLLRIQK